MRLRHKIASWLIRSEAKASPSPTVPFVAPHLSGKPVWKDWDTENAIQHGLKASVWVYRCCRLLASAVSSIPWHVEEATDGGEVWERVPGHPIEILLREANPHMAGQDVFERLTYHLMLGGNALWHMVMVRGMPVELWPLPPDKVTPVPDATTWLKHYEYKIDAAGKPKLLDPREVIHFMLVDPSNPYWGMSPLQSGARVVDSDVEAVDWNKVAMQNRAVADGVFSFEHVMSPEQWAEARKQIREQHQGADNARTPWVLGAGAKWHQMAMTPVEMDFLESRKFSMYEIHAIFGVDPLLTGAPDHSGRANKQEARKSFWTETVIPLLEDLKHQLNMCLVPFWEPESAKAGSQPRLRIVYDVSGVEALQDKFSDQVNNAYKLWNMGVPFADLNQRLQLGFRDDIPGADQPKPLSVNPFGTMDISKAKQLPKGRKASAATWTEEQKKTFWQKRDTTRTEWESEVEKLIVAQFEAEGATVADTYEADGEDAATAAIGELRSEWEATLEATYTAVMEFYGQEQVDRLDDTTKRGRRPSERKFAFDPFGQNVQDWIANYAAQKVTEMSETTKEAIAGEIAEGMADDETRVEIAKRIRALYEHWARPEDSEITVSRALTIARTEVGAASSAAIDLASEQFTDATGIEFEKTWISSRDDRVRDSHAALDGETVEMDDTFSNGLRYPGDPEGPAEEAIQCRCAVAYEPKT
jgi:HK97 family phage portal protein